MNLMNINIPKETCVNWMHPVDSRLARTPQIEHFPQQYPWSPFSPSLLQSLKLVFVVGIGQFGRGKKAIKLLQIIETSSKLNCLKNIFELVCGKWKNN